MEEAIQYADALGKFYHNECKVGDYIKSGVAFGYIQFLTKRDQYSDCTGIIKWLEEDAKKIDEGDPICKIEVLPPEDAIQYADVHGKFYHNEYKVGDNINSGDAFGYIESPEKRDQFSDCSGIIKWLGDDGKKIDEGDPICIIQIVPPENLIT